MPLSAEMAEVARPVQSSVSTRAGEGAEALAPGQLAGARLQVQELGSGQQGLHSARLEGAGRLLLSAKMPGLESPQRHAFLLFSSKVQVLFWVKKLKKCWSLLNLCIWCGLGECLVQGVGMGRQVENRESGECVVWGCLC